MCHEIACTRCGKPTWEGCGEHIEQALKHVPPGDRCTCPRQPATITTASTGHTA
jgi:uncharacterized Zn-binding protein involved in type VI secretion